MFNRAAAIVALDLALCSACGGESPSPSEWSEMDAVVARRAVFAAAASNETKCPDASAEAGGTPLWLQSYDALEISGVAADSQGHVLMARSGAETRKLGCAGELLWSVPFGAKLAVDHEDNVYVAGVRSDGGFVTKLDSAGSVVYDTALGAETSGGIDSLVVDAAGNVAFSGPGRGTSKLDVTGQLLWTQPFVGPLAFDSQGQLWLTGALDGQRDFGAVTLVSQGGTDVLLLELGSDGTPISARSFGDSGALQRGEAIAVDNDDNVWITGTFDGSIDFGAGVLVKRPDTCSSDAWCVTSGFVAKLDQQGRALWSISLATTRALPSVAVDSRGNAAVSSVLPGGVRPYRRPQLLMLNADGQPLWQRADWPDTGVGAGRAVAIDADDNVVWSLSARPSFELEEQSYLAKLSNLQP